MVFSTLDSFIIVSIFIVSFSLRIWNFAIPNFVVFDEYHFGEFINNYINRIFFFDIHPPFCKILFYLFSLLAYYDGSLSFKSLTNNYSSEFYVFFRLIPIVFTSFVPVIIYGILRYSSIAPVASLLVSALAAFEHSLISQSRFILIEGIQHFFICCHLLLLSYYKITNTDNIPYYKKGFLIFIVSESLGICISCKMTAFSLIPFTVLVIFLKHRKGLESVLWKKHFFKILFLNIFVIANSLLLLIILTMCHLMILKNTSLDAVEFLPSPLYNDLFSQSLFTHSKNNFFLYFRSSVKLLFLMNEINQKNMQFHPYQSSPFSWPLLTGIWVCMWDSELGGKRQINCMGNIFVYVPISCAILFVILKCFIFVCLDLYHIAKSSKLFPKMLKKILYIEFSVASISFFGWIISYFPFFFFVKRTTFLYHYQISLIFGIINLGACFQNTKNLSIIVLFITLLFTIYGFMKWRPLLYGELINGIQIEEKIITKRWKYGNERHRKLVESFFDDFQF